MQRILGIITGDVVTRGNWTFVKKAYYLDPRKIKQKYFKGFSQGRSQEPEGSHQRTFGGLGTRMPGAPRRARDISTPGALSGAIWPILVRKLCNNFLRIFSAASARRKPSSSTGWLFQGI